VLFTWYTPGTALYMESVLVSACIPQQHPERSLVDELLTT